MPANVVMVPDAIYARIPLLLIVVARIKAMSVDVQAVEPEAVQLSPSER